MTPHGFIEGQLVEKPAHAAFDVLDWPIRIADPEEEYSIPHALGLC